MSEALEAAVARVTVSAPVRTVAVVSAVVVASDPSWEHAIQWLLAAVAVRVVAAAHDVERAPDLVGRVAPQLLVVDAGDGIEAPRLYRRLVDVGRRGPDVATVVICAKRDCAAADAAVAAGAVRIVARDTPQELVLAVDAVRRALADGAELERPHLTRREVEILRLVGGGRTNREVADLLWVTDQTVKYHLTNVYRKLGVGDRFGAVEWAVGRGLAAPRAQPLDGASTTSW